MTETKKKVKFDVVIGNPPYQEDDGGAAASASPVYQYFVEGAKSLDPNQIVLITPSRWFVGGKGLDDFRNEMLNDKHIAEIHDWLTPQDVFPTTNIRGGVSFFIWDKEKDNTQEPARVVTHEHNKVIADVRRPIKVAGVDIFIRDSIGLGIVKKLQRDLDKDCLAEHMSSRKPFGLATTFDRTGTCHISKNGLKDPVACYMKGATVVYIERADIPSHTEWVDKWKLLTTRANNIGTELPDDNLNTIICPPNYICTETYLVIGIGMNLDENSVKNLQTYTRTKFVRYLHGLSKASHDATSKTYRFIPLQDFTAASDIDWAKSIHEIDEQLYRKYALSDDEINFIEKSIKEMA